MNNFIHKTNNTPPPNKIYSIKINIVFSKRTYLKHYFKTLTTLIQTGLQYRLFLSLLIYKQLIIKIKALRFVNIIEPEQN